jgi:hypothetical protein
MALTLSSVVGLLSGELILPVREEHIEGRKRPVTGGDVLLQLDLLVVAELGVPVDLLLEDPQLVANHDDLVK